MMKSVLQMEQVSKLTEIERNKHKGGNINNNNINNNNEKNKENNNFKRYCHNEPGRN